MINKIIHFSDLHLRLFKEHSRYRMVLTEAMNEWKVESPDRIVFTGDLVHSKNQMTPELLEIVSWTLTECAKICKTIILIGNHDFLENNMDRLDKKFKLFRGGMKVDKKLRPIRKQLDRARDFIKTIEYLLASSSSFGVLSTVKPRELNTYEIQSMANLTSVLSNTLLELYATQSIPLRSRALIILSPSRLVLTSIDISPSDKAYGLFFLSIKSVPTRSWIFCATNDSSSYSESKCL